MDIYCKALKKFLYPASMLINNKFRVLKYLKDFENSQYLDQELLGNYQLTRLKKILFHASETSKYYRNKFSKIGFDPRDLRSFDDFQNIPFLTKKDIQEFLKDLISTKYRVNSLLPNKTGGSTGKPLKFYHDREKVLSKEAATIRHNRWASYEIGSKVGLIWGHREDIKSFNKFKSKLRMKYLNRQMVLDSSSIDDYKLDKFLKELVRFQPIILLGYANSLYLFAEYCEKHGCDELQPKAIITSAEVLHEHERHKIEAVFNTKVFDRYGCREVSVIASECEMHNGLHINSDGLFVEFIKDNGEKAKPGELANIIITDLFNYGMPFIRYKIEDVGALVEKKCSCGRTFPLMSMIGGRTTDFLLGTNGKKISGASITIFILANASGISQAQFIQNEKKSIIMKIIKNEKFGENTISFLNNKLRDFFGSDMKIFFEYVHEIPKEASGKYRFSINNINGVST